MKRRASVVGEQRGETDPQLQPFIFIATLTDTVGQFGKEQVHFGGKDLKAPLKCDIWYLFVVNNPCANIYGSYKSFPVMSIFQTHLSEFSVYCPHLHILNTKVHHAFTANVSRKEGSTQWMMDGRPERRTDKGG